MQLEKGSVVYQLRETNGGRVSFFDLPSIAGYLIRNESDLSHLSFVDMPQQEIKELYRMVREKQ